MSRRDEPNLISFESVLCIERAKLHFFPPAAPHACLASSVLTAVAATSSNGRRLPRVASLRTSNRAPPPLTMLQEEEQEEDLTTRLDARGFHRIPTKREDVFVRWATDANQLPDPEEDGFLLGSAIEVSQNGNFDCADNFRVAVGDFVYLTGCRKGQPAEIHRVEELCQVDNKQKKNHGIFYIYGTTFWRAERLKLSDRIDWHLKELFECWKTVGSVNAEDTCQNPAHTFLELTHVNVSRCEGDATGFKDGDHSFFFRFDRSHTRPSACFLVTAIPLPLLLPLLFCRGPAFDSLAASRKYWPKTNIYTPLDPVEAGPAAAEAAAPVPDAGQPAAAGQPEDAGQSAAAGQPAAAPATATDDEPARKRAKPGEHKARIDGLVAEVNELRAQVAELQAQQAGYPDILARLSQLESK